MEEETGVLQLCTFHKSIHLSLIVNLNDNASFEQYMDDEASTLGSRRTTRTSLEISNEDNDDEEGSVIGSVIGTVVSGLASNTVLQPNVCTNKFVSC